MPAGEPLLCQDLKGWRSKQRSHRPTVAMLKRLKRVWQLSSTKAKGKAAAFQARKVPDSEMLLRFCDDWKVSNSPHAVRERIKRAHLEGSARSSSHRLKALTLWKFFNHSRAPHGLLFCMLIYFAVGLPCKEGKRKKALWQIASARAESSPQRSFSWSFWLLAW